VSTICRLGTVERGRRGNLPADLPNRRVFGRTSPSLIALP
jgi:hypothetical protein